MTTAAVVSTASRAFTFPRPIMKAWARFIIASKGMPMAMIWMIWPVAE